MPSICTRRLPRRKRRNRTSESSAGCIAQRATYSPTRCPRSLQPLDQGVRSLSQLRKSNDTQDVRGTCSRAVGNSSDHPAELLEKGLSTGNRPTCPLIGKDLDLAASADVALYLNRRLWPLTALNSWARRLSTGSISRRDCT